MWHLRKSFHACSLELFKKNKKDKHSFLFMLFSQTRFLRGNMTIWTWFILAVIENVAAESCSSPKVLNWFELGADCFATQSHFHTPCQVGWYISCRRYFNHKTIH